MRNFSIYARARYEDLPCFSFFKDKAIFLFDKGVFCDEADRLHAIEGMGIEAGRRTIDRLDGGVVLSLIRDLS